MLAPVFTGRVLEKGLLVLDKPKDYAAHVKGLHGKFVELVLRPRRTKRSLQQNAWHWGVAIPLIAETLGYDLHEHEQVHYALVSKCFGVTINLLTGLEVPKVRSSQLTPAEFSTLMEWEVRFAATELDCRIPLPGDVG